MQTNISFAFVRKLYSDLDAVQTNSYWLGTWIAMWFLNLIPYKCHLISFSSRIWVRTQGRLHTLWAVLPNISQPKPVFLAQFLILPRYWESSIKSSFQTHFSNTVSLMGNKDKLVNIRIERPQSQLKGVKLNTSGAYWTQSECSNIQITELASQLQRKPSCLK